MRTFLEILTENILDESVFNDVKKIVGNIGHQLTKSEYLRHGVKVKDEVSGNGISVKPLQPGEITQHRMNGIHFIPTHTIKTADGVHVVGKDFNDSTKHVIYKKRADGTFHEVSGFDLLHSHPTILQSHIGQQLYKQHREAFKALPITASSSKIENILSKNKRDTIGGVSVHNMQKIAVNHKNAGPGAVDALINSNHHDHDMLRRAITHHGLTRKQATKIIRAPHIHHAIKTIAHGRLTQP